MVGPWGNGRASASLSTLARVRAAGVLRCGIDVEEAEYTTADDHGNRQSFDADLCRAVAAAVLGAKARIAVTQYPDDAASMQGLSRGDVDMVPTLTDDFTHSAGTPIRFSRPVLWDGVGFLVLDSSPVTRADQLSGRKVCFLAETTVEASARSWFARQHFNFVPFPFQEEGEMEAAFATGNCGALAGDWTRLAETRAALARHRELARLLPGSLSKDPLAAATRENDPHWTTLVDWVMEALVQAEESGVTQANVERMGALAAEPACPDLTLRFLLGGSRQIGGTLGLDNFWVVRAVAATGNYGEIYQRDLGSASILKLPRGENNLRAHGGMMMALPFK